MTPADDLRLAAATGTRLAARLRASLAQLDPLRPFDAARVAAMDEADAVATDAFLKRFENLTNHLQDTLWRRAAVLEGFRNPGTMSRRDLADLMEKLGLLASADAFVGVVLTRNRLSHFYPDDPARQAGQLNDACNDAATLLAAADAAVAWATRRAAPP